jgi:aarF domain-containing kinase
LKSEIPHKTAPDGEMGAGGSKALEPVAWLFKKPDAATGVADASTSDDPWDELTDEQMEALSDEELDALLSASGEDDDEDAGAEDQTTSDDDTVVTPPATSTPRAASTPTPAPKKPKAPKKAKAPKAGRGRGPVAATLGAIGGAKDALASTARRAVTAASSAVKHHTNVITTTPKKQLAARLALASLKGVRGAATHAVATSFAGCYLPKLTLVVKAAAAVSVAAPLIRGSGIGPKLAAVSPVTLKSVKYVAELVSPVSPDVVADLAKASAPAVKLGGKLAKSFAKSHARYLVVRAVLRVVSREKTRRVEYAVRVAPIVAAYGVKKPLIRRKKLPSQRDAAWLAMHRWGAAEMRRVIADFGGFYRKVGQIMGTARQMMPDPYIEAFAETMDNNPPVPFKHVRRLVERSLGGKLSEHFLEFEEKPLATASIAQVHQATLLKNKKKVVVKVRVTDVRTMVGDVRSMLHTTLVMKRLGLDNGVDFPTIFRAYLDVIAGEFDFTAEAAKIAEFRELFEAYGLSDRVVVPTVIDDLSTSEVLVMERVKGVKLLSVLNRARRRKRRPLVPAAAAKVHVDGGIGWDGVFDTMFRCWSVMLLRHGHYHSDPHPGNFMIAKDGRLAILDWGQTQVAPEAYRHHLCRLVVSMVAEDYPKIAEEVRLHSQVQLERPTTEALAALCYAYFDTRPTPLAEVNMMDLNNSPFLQNRITQNTQEGFFTIRSVFLLRGMMATCGVTASMVEAWEEDARAVLRASGDRTVPSVISSRSRRMLTRTWLGLQKSLNVGAGARLNTLEAYTATGATMDDGGVGSGRASPQDPRRMSSLW